MESFEILGGKVQLYRRPDSSFWWCATRLNGKQRRKTTKQESLKLAEAIATDWYLTLQGKLRTGDSSRAGKQRVAKAWPDGAQPTQAPKTSKKR
jgi:hypothetical protein